MTRCDNDDRICALIDTGLPLRNSFWEFGTALHYACFLVRPVIVNKLLEVEECLMYEKSPRSGNTPLHWLFLSFDNKPEEAAQVFNILLSHKVELDARNSQDMTFLSLSVHSRLYRGLLYILR